MKPGAITQTVALHLLKNAKPKEFLEGCLGKPGYFETATGKERRTYETVYGRAEDILADMIERKRFFGEYVPESSSQADNCNNGFIRRLSFDGIEGKVTISGWFIGVAGKPGSLIVELPQISEKDYLTLLRTPEQFVAYAATLDVPGYEERIRKLFGI